MIEKGDRVRILAEGPFKGTIGKVDSAGEEDTTIFGEVPKSIGVEFEDQWVSVFRWFRPEEVEKVDVWGGIKERYLP